MYLRFQNSLNYDDDRCFWLGCFPEHLCICASCNWPQSERVLVCRSLRDCAPRWDSARSFYEPCCDSGSLEADSQALIYTATEKCSVIGNQTCESRHGFRALSGGAAVYQARPFMPHPRGLGANLMDLRRLIQENMKLARNAFSIRSDLLFVLPARGTLFLWCWILNTLAKLGKAIWLPLMFLNG